MYDSSSIDVEYLCASVLCMAVVFLDVVLFIQMKFMMGWTLNSITSSNIDIVVFVCFVVYVHFHSTVTSSTSLLVIVTISLSKCVQ